MSNLPKILKTKKKKRKKEKKRRNRKYHPAQYMCFSTAYTIKHAKIFAQFNYVYLFIGNTFYEVHKKEGRKKKTWDKKKVFRKYR